MWWHVRALTGSSGLSRLLNEKNNKIYHVAFAIRLTSTHPCKDDYVLEFVLPGSMKETLELELLINKVLCTLQRKCI
ncbi:hypothetical protein NC652_006474 [Populus alba x Populus x berolinensis]|nr:hypothetical protein NC652_006474 [Populus alba x Populus x berolinensis]